jgi:Fic family protein
LGRAEADITKWIEYFVEGMAIACENIIKHLLASKTTSGPEQDQLWRKLGSRERKVLDLFQEHAIITAAQIASLFGFQSRTASAICAKWVESGFLTVIDPARRSRKYGLSKEYQRLL